jgi:hypothetical protein
MGIQAWPNVASQVAFTWLASLGRSCIMPCSADLAPALAGDGRAICWQRALVWAMGPPLHRFLGASSRRLCLPLAGARWPICPQQCEGAQAWRLQGA